LRRLAFDLVAGTAGTPRRNFAVSKSLTQSLTVGGVASKRSGSTYAPSPIVQPPGPMLAWGVLFGDGDVLSAGKTDHDYIRAVRCGFARSDIR
jgi:hypothetical protein